MTERELRLIALNLALKAHRTNETMSALFLISEANRIYEFILSGSQFIDRDKNPSEVEQSIYERQVQGTL